jgi:hypothetical protein
MPGYCQVPSLVLLPLRALDLGKPLLQYATAADGTNCYPYLWVIVTVLLDRIFGDAQGNPILSVACCRGYPFSPGLHGRSSRLSNREGAAGQPRDAVSLRNSLFGEK